MNDNHDKNDRLEQPVCHLVRGPGFLDKPVDPFNERLRVATISHDSLVEFSSHLQKRSAGNLQLVAGLGKVSLQGLLMAGLKGNQPNGLMPASLLLNWNQPRVSMRNMAVAAETILITGFNGPVFDPARMLGWGFAKASESLDPATDPARMLRHVAQAFRRNHHRDRRVETAKALFANVIARATSSLPQRMDLAFDGTTLLCSFQTHCDDKMTVQLENTAKRLAAWLDQANGQTPDTLTAWVRQTTASTLETGVIFNATEIQTALVVEPRLEQSAQVRYNVA